MSFAAPCFQRRFSGYLFVVKVGGLQTLPIPVYLTVRCVKPRGPVPLPVCLLIGFSMFCFVFLVKTSRHFGKAHPWVPDHSPTRCEVKWTYTQTGYIHDTPAWPANQVLAFRHSQAGADSFINYVVVGMAPVFYNNNGADALCTHGRVHFDTGWHPQLLPLEWLVTSDNMCVDIAHRLNKTDLQSRWY